MNQSTSMADSRLLAARDAGLRGEHQRAVDLCVAVLQETPGDPAALAFLGLSLWRAEAYAQAVDVLGLALRHWPRQAELSLALLDSWRALGQQEHALRFAAALPPDVLSGPSFRTWRAALEKGVDELGPGLSVEDRLARLYDQGLLIQLEQELTPRLQEHPRWAKGWVLKALLMFSNRGQAVSADMLQFPAGASVAEVEARWRSVLAEAMTTYRDQVVAQTQAALSLCPDDAKAKVLLAQARFENGLPFSRADVDAVAALLNLRLLDSAPLRTAIGPAAPGVMTAALLEQGGLIDIPVPRSVGAHLDLNGAIGPALTCSRYVAVARNATVAPGSDVVLLSDGSAICDPLSHALGEIANYFSDGWIVMGGTRQVLLRELPVTHVAGTAMSLMGASAGHYGHWLMDHLMRLRALLEHPLAREARVLVSADMPASHYEALQLLLEPGVVIQRVAAESCVRVDQLLFAGPDVFFPHLIRRGVPPIPSVAPSSIGGMVYLRDRMIAAVSAPKRQRRRFFVRRCSGTRQVLNEGDVRDLLINDWGFEELYPEALTFADQVRSFHDADVVVGVQGSALSNCVFCRPGTRVIAFCSGFSANFPAWAHALECVGLQHCFVAGEAQQGSHFLAIQCDFRVNLEALGAALSALGVAP